MYTDAKQVQIIIKMLKEYSIRDVVISPGTRNFPFVHSIEKDPFFRCYSIVDERSAAYFAMGIMLETGNPCVVSCTSGTASANYHSAVCECHFQGLPLVLLTADRNPILWGQMENLMISQTNMYGEMCKKSVSIPCVLNENDYWYCYRTVNEALLELTHYKKGPVQINYVVEDWQLNQFNTKELPAIKRINKIDRNDDDIIWESVVEELVKNNRRVIVNCGQNNVIDTALMREMETFYEKTNSIISCDYTSNIRCKGVIFTANILDGVQGEIFDEMCPALVISINGQYLSGMKWALKGSKYRFDNWRIEETGKIVDEFRYLTKLFEMSPIEFFGIMNKFLKNKEKNEHEYYKLWKEKQEMLDVYEIDFSNMYVIKSIIEDIPSNSNLHLGNIRSAYIAQCFELKDDVYVYAHNGTTTIDGSLSTFIGQAAVSNKDSYCIIGDLSFFYDMNAVWNRYLSPKVRIILINNGGGEEFYTNVVRESDSLNDFTAAGHSQSAEAWVVSLGFQYVGVHTIEEFEANKSILYNSDASKPIFMEIFTDLEKEASIWFEYRERKLNTLRLNKQNVENDLPLHNACDTMKLQANFDVCRDLLCLKDIRNKLEEYFLESKIRNLALYGVGQIGKIVYDYLEDTIIDVRYGIDISGNGRYKTIKIFSIENNFDGVDAILVTVPFDNEIIVRELKKHTNVQIICLTKLVSELKK